MSPSTPDELITIISSLQDKKAIRNYDYETEFIKLAKISIADFLTRLFNFCLTRGVFPKAFKIAEVVPTYKKGKVYEPTNYRPISLLSQFSKIIKKTFVQMRHRLSRKIQIIINTSIRFSRHR